MEAGADKKEAHDAAAAGAPCYIANFLLGCEGRASTIDSKGCRIDVDVYEIKFKDNTLVAMNMSLDLPQVQAYNHEPKICTVSNTTGRLRRN